MVAVAGKTTMKIPALGIILGILAALFIGNVKAQEHHLVHVAPSLRVENSHGRGLPRRMLK